jgi:quercetin dioxygenase-like cupin family protein
LVLLLFFIAVAALWIARAFAASSPVSAGDIHILSQQPLAGRTGTDVTILTVDYPPGGSTPPHQHPGTTCAYVLQGSVVSQVDDGPTQTFTAGQTWTEQPHDHHMISKNASLNGTGETTGLHDRTARRTTDDLPALANFFSLSHLRKSDRI